MHELIENVLDGLQGGPIILSRMTDEQILSRTREILVEYGYPGAATASNEDLFKMSRKWLEEH